VRRVVYLGGLESSEASEHLRSRHEVAEILREHVPELVYARAAMVVGDGSASFRILCSLVDRLPAMITPRWVQTRTQPIAIADVVDALVGLVERDEAPEEVHLGGADVLSYREMMDRYARLTGRRPRPMVAVPLLTPRLSSYWVTLFSPVEHGLVRPLVDGLGTEMLVRVAPPPGVLDDPMGFDEAVRAALGT
jgi:uncharacterized protein YbjT (DUF2867 family)